jgi:hypothetical protein
VTTTYEDEWGKPEGSIFCVNRGDGASIGTNELADFRGGANGAGVGVNDDTGFTGWMVYGAGAGRRVEGLGGGTNWLGAGGWTSEAGLGGGAPNGLRPEELLIIRY